MIQTEAVTIPDHIHGYPQVAFGGYVAGMLARRSGAETLRVDFRRAVPVESPLELPAGDPGHATLTAADGTLLAQAGPATLDITAAPLPTWAEALAATESALTSPKRPSTDCFGCGVECAPGHGLRLFSWPVHDRRDLMAAAWTPDPGLADAAGELPPEIVWSALDCPGGIAAFAFQRMPLGAVTAALTATQYRPMPAGADYLAHAWPVHHEGRKYTVGVALSTRDGELCALAEALWVAPRTPAG
ncbi:PaaI family thioesterase [Nocardia sp. NPDC059177]|uniref:PaaI family thioesterase n=1 Tax=Nocardia sp. NPDC059177 TaxID=3346759 RepID=UPI0036A881ED